MLKVVDGQEMRRSPDCVSSIDGRIAVKSKNSSASIVANGAALQLWSKYSAADEAALPASFHPENANTMTGSCADRRWYQSKCAFCDPPRCSVTRSRYLGGVNLQQHNHSSNTCLTSHFS